MTGVVEWMQKRPYGVIGAAAVIAHLVIAIVRTQNAWFFADDFQNLMIAAGPRGLPGQMLESVFGQYVPLYRVTNFALLHLFGLSFAPALAFLLACSACAVGMLIWICARMRLPIIATIAIGAFLACTWMPFEGQSWWSAGLHIIPGAAALCTCLAIAARPSVRLGLVHGLALAAILAIGIGYYNAVLFVFGPVATIRWYIRLREQPDTPFFKRIVGVLVDLAPAIVVVTFAVAAIAWLAGARTASPPLEIATGIGMGVGYGLGAGIVGARGFAEATSTGDLALWGVVGGGLLLGVVVASLIRAPRTAWLWAGCWAFVLLQLWIIGGERIATFGPWILASPRYNFSNVLVFVATAIIAFGRRYPYRTVVASRPARTVTAGVGGLLTLAIVVSNINTGLALKTPGEMSDARTFISALRDTAPAGITSVGNRTLPNFLTPHWTGGFATLYHFSTIAPAKLKMTPWAQATHFIADEGALASIAAQPAERWTWPDGRSADVRVLPPIDSVGEIIGLQRADSVTLIGWANPLMQKDSAARVVAVTPTHAAVEAARRDYPSPYLSQRYRMAEFDTAGFEITLPAGVEPSDAQVFLLLGDGIAIPIPRPPQLSELPLASQELANVGDPLTLVSVTSSPAFAENGWFPEAPKPPFPGRAFGSFAPLGDAGKGDITLTLDCPPGLRAIIVPVLTGPTSKGARVTVSTPSSPTPIATLADPEVQSIWRLWTVDLPPGFAGSQLNVRIEDTSSEWGAWAAIGPVHAKKPAN